MSNKLTTNESPNYLVTAGDQPGWYVKNAKTGEKIGPLPYLLALIKRDIANKETK